MIAERRHTVERAIATFIQRQLGRQRRDQIALQGDLAGAQPQQVGHMHKAGGTAADPVGVFFGEALHPRDDQTTLRGMVGHVGRQIAPATGEVFGLLEGEAITAHQHLHVAVLTQAHHHADPRQVVADALAHADAVGPLVALRRSLDVVVEAVQAADEGVVGAAALIGELPVAEINAAVVADADEGPLA